MANLTNLWTQGEDVFVIAGGVLRIPAPEMAVRFLPGRTPEAINMRLHFLRRGIDPRKLDDPQAETTRMTEAQMGSQNLLVAILRWAAAHGKVPPGLTAERVRELCREHGVDIPSDGLKLRQSGNGV